MRRRSWVEVCCSLVAVIYHNQSVVGKEMEMSRGFLRFGCVKMGLGELGSRRATVNMYEGVVEHHMDTLVVGNSMVGTEIGLNPWCCYMEGSPEGPERNLHSVPDTDIVEEEDSSVDNSPGFHSHSHHMGSQLAAQKGSMRAGKVEELAGIVPPADNTAAIPPHSCFHSRCRDLGGTACWLAVAGLEVDSLCLICEPS